MDNIISIDAFKGHFKAEKDFEDIKKRSKIYKTQERMWDDRCKTLKSVQKRMNLPEFLKLEVFIVTYDLERTDTTKELKASVTQALQQYTDAQRSLSVVHNPEEYQNVNASYSRKTRDSSQLPQDACRQFIRSQIARLSNKLTNDLSEGEIQYISLRRDNMYCAEKLYKEMQKQALGIPLEQKKGLTR